MLTLSQITLDPRRKPIGAALGDLYALHRMVYMAFPSRDSGGAGRILYRNDIDRRSGMVKLIVQSDRRPDWSTFANLAETVDGPKDWAPAIGAGSVLRFRLRASPTKRILLPREDPGHGKRRQGLVSRDEQIAWLLRQAIRNGFELVDAGDEFCDPDGCKDGQIMPDMRVVSLGKLTGRKEDKTVITVTGAEFDGVLRVTDATLFHAAISDGIGPAKGFGFGLLSLMRM